MKHRRPTKVRLVRAPFMYRYFDLDVREDSIITMLAGYLESAGYTGYDVCDFHLECELCADSVFDNDVEAYVLSIREVSDNVGYSLRIAHRLRELTDAPIYLYGETARLHRLRMRLPSNTQIVKQNEQELVAALGLPLETQLDFAHGQQARPYLDALSLSPWQRSRLKGTVETTRGCHYPCRFCFINAGDNYGKPWQRRPNDAILADVRKYYERGIHSIVFHDAEFFGADRRQYPAIREMLQRIREEFPMLAFMIYARADTLMQFDDLDLLKSAGLCNVFLGAESLEQSDLDALKKKLTVEQITECVEALKRYDVHMHLNFILFNRNSSIQSIRQNLTRLRQVFSGNVRAAGLPHFSFSFETDWSEAGSGKELGQHTYVKNDLAMRSQPVTTAAFDAGLEPYMEVCRLLSYEWLRKVVDLSHKANARSPYWDRTHRLAGESRKAAVVSAWYERLPMFCIDVMDYFLDEFESGELTVFSLRVARETLFEKIRAFYEVLPPALRSLVTYEEHAATLSYAGESGLVEVDEYWVPNIPWTVIQHEVQ